MTGPVELPPSVDRAVYERQAQTMQSFLDLLNQISKLGVQGFGAVIDAASADELGLLAQSAAVVRAQIAKFQASQGVSPPTAGP
jgi:hypothetical protein